MSEELNPCPFCGHMPEVKADDYYKSISCPYCLASTKVLAGFDEKESKTNALATMWNNGFIYAPEEKLPYRLFRALERLS